MLSSSQRRRLLLSAEAATRKSSDPTRHKCFLSYHADDVDAIKDFIDSFGHVLIPKVIGVSDEDAFIDSDTTDYVMNQIREKYLADSSVTIVFVGQCTWARRYVDWEVYSTLRRDKTNRLSGLMAITLPSVAGRSDRKLPPRVEDNVDGSYGYARWLKYPRSASQLRGLIDEAFEARTNRDHLINNNRPRKLRNSSC